MRGERERHGGGEDEDTQTKQAKLRNNILHIRIKKIVSGERTALISISQSYPEKAPEPGRDSNLDHAGKTRPRGSAEHFPGYHHPQVRGTE